MSNKAKLSDHSLTSDVGAVRQGATRKVVVNRCYGGFSLSHAGVLAYARHKGVKLYPERSEGQFPYWTYWLVPPEDQPEPQDDWQKWTPEQRIASNAAHAAAELSPNEIARDDPALVAAVEELGQEAGGNFSKLDATEIPADVDWLIEEYDGREWIAERHRTW